MLTKDDIPTSGEAFIDDAIELLALMHDNELLDSLQIEREVEFYLIHGEPELAIEGAASMIDELEVVQPALEVALRTIADGFIDLPKFYTTR